MFDKDFQIRGRHATYWKALSKTPGNATETSVNFKVFSRYVDVYMVAPIIGLLNNRKGFYESDDDNDTAGMLAEVLIKNQNKLKYIYRLIILLDDTEVITQEDRLNRAFREDGNEESVEEGMRTFNEYFLGGLEVLHETFVQSCTTEEDYINRIHSFVEEFKNEQNIDELELDIEQLLRK
jgi:hypothetical protein